MPVFKWTKLLGTTENEGEDPSIAIGNNGSIYVAGTTDDNINLHGNKTNGEEDLFIVKLTTDGNKKWTKHFGSNKKDVITDIEIANDESIYISGFTNGNLNGQKYNGENEYAGFIVKLDLNGNEVWTKIIGSSDKEYEAMSINIDKEGFIYLFGETDDNLNGQSNNGNDDIYIIKLDPSGNKIWTKLIGSKKDDYPTSSVVNDDGSIYIGGYTEGNLNGEVNSGEQDIFISKLDHNGNHLWTKLFGNKEEQKAWSISIGKDGSIYIAGDTEGNLNGEVNSGNLDAFIMKLNNNGNHLWTKLFGNHFYDYANSIDIDQDESIYITGSTTGENLNGEVINGLVDTFIIKLNSDGKEDWTKVFGSSTWDEGRSLKVDNNKSIYVSGTTQGNLNNEIHSGGKDTYVIKMSLNVNELNDVITGTSEIDVINGGSNNNKITGHGGNDIIDGGGGSDTSIYSGKFSDYSFTRETNSLVITDQRTGTNDGTDTLQNIEYIQFSEQTVKESKIDISKSFSGNFRDYKFYNKGNGVYQIKTDSGYDDITGIPLLTFTGEATTSSFRDVSAIVDIKGTFDQVTGLNTDDAKMFRLYNAAFKRLPDTDGLKYWIAKYTSGENDERAVSSSFLASAEFKERYGDNITNETYVQNLYLNVLNRELDQGGYDYWVGNLNNGIEQRHEVLLGFSESAENKALFTDMTGFA